jgi:integrase
MHAVLRSALSKAEKEGLVARNVAKLAPPPAREAPEVCQLTVEQTKHFLSFAKQEGLYSLSVVAAMTGMRQGEILGLRWSDVNLEKNSLGVSQQAQREGKMIVFVPPKTKKSKRRIQLPPVVVEALKDHLTEQQAQKAMPGWVDLGLVFTARNGTAIDRANLYRRFQRILRLAELPPITFHTLRHGCASFLAAEGVQPALVAELLGHSTVKLTQDTYTHFFETAKTQVAQKIDALFPAATATKSLKEPAAVSLAVMGLATALESGQPAGN